MASQHLSKLLPTISRSCFKRAFHSQNTEKYQRLIQQQFVEHEENVHGAIAPSSHVHDIDSYMCQETFHIEVPKPREPKFDNKSDSDNKSASDLLEIRLQILQKQLQCSEEEVLSLFEKVPRLHDLKLLDKVIRNIDVLLYLYEPKTVAGFIKVHPCHLVQIDNGQLMGLGCGRREDISKFMSAADNLVKGDNVSEAEFFASLLGFKPSDELPLVFTSHMSYSNIKETVEFLLQEGVPKSFLQQYSEILMYSMKRLNCEVQYIKREFGELDAALLRCRIMETNSKGFRKSVKATAELLECPSSAFTSLQKKHLVRIYITDVEDSIECLLGMGFSLQDIRSCVYIIGQKPEQIKAAKNKVLRTHNIDDSDKQTLINAILYQIKTWVGFGS